MSKPTTRNPLYVQVADYVMQQIAADIYKPHHAIPTEWQLAKKLDVSQGTVRKGLDDLVARNVLYRQQGVGTFVADQYGDWGQHGLVGVYDKDTHVIYPKFEVLSVVAVHADNEIVGLLNLKTISSLVWRVLIVWRHQIHTVALDELYLPYEKLPELNRRQLITRLNIGDLLLKEYEIRLKQTNARVGVGGLNPEQASILKVSADEPILFMQIRHEDASKQLLMMRKRYVLTRHYQLNLSTVPMV